jgi:hypothetical protein
MKSRTFDQVTEPRSSSMWATVLTPRWQITHNQEGHSFTWITRAPSILVTARHPFDGAAKGPQAALPLDFSGPLGPVCVRLTPGSNARYLVTEARGLKKRVEGHTQSQASKSCGLEGSR